MQTRVFLPFAIYTKPHEMTEHAVDAFLKWDNLGGNLTYKSVSIQDPGSDFLMVMYVFYAAFICYRAIFTILGGHISVGNRSLGMCEWQKEKKSC